MIIQVITEPVAGGAEALVRETHQRFLGRGLDAEAVFFNAGNRELREAEYSLGTGLRSPVNIWKLRQYFKAKIRENDKVIVHAHLTWPFIYVALATLFLNVRLFYTEHNTHNKRRANRLFRILDRFLYGRYQRVICISEGVFDSLSRWVGPRLARKLVVVPNGARLYSPVHRPAPEASGLRLVSVGSLNRKKNFATAIGAVARARHCVEKYTIVGDGPERASLEALIAEHGLQSVVRLVGWSDEVERYFAEADAQLIPSLWEGFGLVAVEGMSSGLPVIASNVDGLREVLSGAGDSVTLISDVQSTQAWGEAISALFDRLRVENIGEIAAKSRTQAEGFSLDRMVERYLAEYRDFSRRGRTLVMVVNSPAFFVSHRLSVALAAQAAGYNVIVVTGPGEKVADIVNAGLQHRAIPISRSGQSLGQELRTLLALVGLFRDFSPDLVHLVTIKPVLYGGLAARLTGVKSVVAAVSGLGTAFSSNGGLAALRRFMVVWFYRIALHHRNIRVIFQNPEDMRVLESKGVIDGSVARLIRGSGVDLAEYQYVEEQEGVPVVVMAARLLREKGVGEFVAAARILRDRQLAVRFQLAGDLDPENPGSITGEQLEQWREEGVVEILGFRDDIARLYSAAAIVCLPSYYGEGLPKSLIEAAACGRPVVTTDWPGCRDAVIPGETALLVPPGDAVALANSIQTLLDSHDLRQQFGRKARRFAEREFAIEGVVQKHLAIYQELTSTEDYS